MPKARNPETVKTILALAVLVWLVLGSCLVLDRPLVRGDGLAYFMWLDSMARDWDLDLTNQAAKFAQVNTYQVFLNSKTGRYASAFPFGSALLWVPWYWLSTAADHLPLLHVNDAYFVQHQGVTLAFSFFPMLGTNLYALAAVVLAYLAARRLASHKAALVTALTLFWGTPLWYYATVEPFSSHVAGTLAVSLLLYLCVRWRVPSQPAPPGHPERSEGTHAWWLWLLAGLAAGLAALVRWQLALYALPLGAVLLWKREGRLLASFGVGFVALAWLVPYSWWRMFGSPWVIPAAEQNRSAFLVWPTHLGQVLFSGEKGLFVWAPLTALALLGLVVLYRKQRDLSLGLAAMFVLQALINASVYDWWAGWGFGMRRMAEAYPVFVIGLAALLSSRLPAGWWRRLYHSALALAVTAATAYAGLLLFSHLNYINTVLDRPQGSTAASEICYQVRESSWHITWLVMKDHYGPWAWRKPGP